MDVVGHEHLHPGAIGEPELAGGESRAGPARVPLRPQVDGVAGPDVLPTAYGVGDVIEDHIVDGLSVHVVARITR